jgi:hypothetical protein
MRFVIVHLLMPCFQSLFRELRSGNIYVQTGLVVTVGLVVAALVARYSRSQAQDAQGSEPADPFEA